MSYKAVYFDMDGTVLDTLKDLQLAVNYAITYFGYPKRPDEYIRQILGFGAPNLIRRALPEDVSDAEFEKVLDFYNPYYKEHSLINTKPFPGIVDLIDELNSKGVKTAVISNKPDNTVQVLGEKFFPNVRCVGAKPGIPIKPDPAPLIAVAKEDGLNSDEVIYVGDTEFDIMGARNAGMGLVVITHGFRDRSALEKYDVEYMTDNVEELRSALLMLLQK